MGTSVYLSSRSKVRINRKKTETKPVAIVSAQYSKDFFIFLTFSNGITKPFDFLPLLSRYAKGSNLKYLALDHFKKFHVKGGNIYWGKDEDLIFPISTFLDNKKSREDELLYIL